MCKTILCVTGYLSIPALVRRWPWQGMGDVCLSVIRNTMNMRKLSSENRPPAVTVHYTVLFRLISISPVCCFFCVLISWGWDPFGLFWCDWESSHICLLLSGPGDKSWSGWKQETAALDEDLPRLIVTNFSFISKSAQGSQSENHELSSVTSLSTSMLACIVFLKGIKMEVPPVILLVNYWTPRSHSILKQWVLHWVLRVWTSTINI